MEEDLNILQNYPELSSLFMGEELYVIDEPRYYENIKSEGGNKFRFLNIFSHGGTESIPPAHRDMFFKIINSIQTDKIKMDADGFAVININGLRGLKWNNLEKNFAPRYCIFWGVDPTPLDVVCKLNGGTIVNDCKIIYVNPINIIAESKDLKQMLWKYIKKMFSIA